MRVIDTKQPLHVGAFVTANWFWRAAGILNDAISSTPDMIPIIFPYAAMATFAIELYAKSILYVEQPDRTKLPFHGIAKLYDLMSSSSRQAVKGYYLELSPEPPTLPIPNIPTAARLDELGKDEIIFDFEKTVEILDNSFTQFRYYFESTLPLIYPPTAHCFQKAVRRRAMDLDPSLSRTLAPGTLGLPLQ